VFHHLLPTFYFVPNPTEHVKSVSVSLRPLTVTVTATQLTQNPRRPSDSLWSTLIGYPIASALPCLYGILVASAAKKVTGTAYWNLWDTLDYMLTQYPESENRGARFAIFLVAVSMALAYLAVNLATNSLPFGSDVSALFPRWMTIRRGREC
jgi:NCS1 family nucleobase:cation symporter-1